MCASMPSSMIAAHQPSIRRERQPVQRLDPKWADRNLHCLFLSDDESLPLRLLPTSTHHLVSNWGYYNWEKSPGSHHLPPWPNGQGA